MDLVPNSTSVPPRKALSWPSLLSASQGGYLIRPKLYLDLVRLARYETRDTKLFRLLGRLTDWAANFESRLWTEWGASNAEWFKLSEFGFRVHLLCMSYCHSCFKLSSHRQGRQVQLPSDV